MSDHVDAFDAFSRMLDGASTLLAKAQMTKLGVQAVAAAVGLGSVSALLAAARSAIAHGADEAAFLNVARVVFIAAGGRRTEPRP
jgi:hypothetical protein